MPIVCRPIGRPTDHNSRSYHNSVQKEISIIICVISGFRREVAEHCALLGGYADSSKHPEGRSAQ